MFRIPFPLIFIFLLFSCEKEEDCPQKHVESYVYLQDTERNPIEPDSYYTYRLSTGELVNKGHGDTTRTFPEQGYTLVLEDMELLVGGREVFRFTAYVDSEMIVDERYTFTYDGCNISKIAGKDTLTIDLN